MKEMVIHLTFNLNCYINMSPVGHLESQDYGFSNSKSYSATVTDIYT
jgi:hypothetical protein